MDDYIRNEPSEVIEKVKFPCLKNLMNYVTELNNDYFQKVKNALREVEVKIKKVENSNFKKSKLEWIMIKDKSWNISLSNNFKLDMKD